MAAGASESKAEQSTCGRQVRGLMSSVLLTLPSATSFEVSVPARRASASFVLTTWAPSAKERRWASGSASGSSYGAGGTAPSSTTIRQSSDQRLKQVRGGCSSVGLWISHRRSINTAYTRLLNHFKPLVMLCYIMLCCVVLCYVMLCYVTSRHGILCYAICFSLPLALGAVESDRVGWSRPI